MTKQESLRLIDKSYSRLVSACDHLREWDRYVALIEQEEKDHRRFCPDGVSCGLTKAQSVRLFAVQTVFERFVANGRESVYTPEAKDFFHVRNSIFAACAIAESAHQEIRAEFKETEMTQFLLSIDYAELNKDPNLQVA